MAEFYLNCAKCRQKLEILEEWRGKRIACPECGCEMRLSLTAGTDGDTNPFAPVDLEEKPQAAKTQKKYSSRIFGKFIFLLFLLALAGTGLYFILKPLLFIRSGFHQTARIDSTIVMSSGHGFFLTAEKNHEDFTGKLSTPTQGPRKLWMKMEFKDGKADGDQIIYRETANDDTPVLTLNFEKGRLRQIKPADGKSAKVKYDILDRPESVSFELDGNQWDIICRYHWSGGLNSTEAGIFAGSFLKIKGAYSDSSFPAHADFVKKDGTAIGSANFEYDEYNNISNYKFFTVKGKELKNPKIKLNGTGLIDILFFIMTI